MNISGQIPSVNRYFAPCDDLLAWRDADPGSAVSWKPEALAHDQWPPNYKAVYAWRLETLAKLRNNPDMLAAAKVYYKTRPAEFIMHWMDTYDPRKNGSKWIPFVFFKRQEQFIQFLVECTRDNESGLTEKCRDAGATWGACAYSVHSWLFLPNDAIGWGSRKEDLVDKLGDPSSIFEKMRLIVNRLPDVWRPAGLNPKLHLTFMKMINPENGSIITGEAGDNIGRGGRTRIYFKDEAAYYERAEKVEAALGDNTKVQIDISSVNGLGNVFHRRRDHGIDWTPDSCDLKPGFVRVFVVDWRDHPEKTQQWYDQRRARYEREGMLHIFAQEVDRNYSAAVSNTIIPYEWIVACVDAHKRVIWRDANGAKHLGIADQFIGDNWMAGLDIADAGIDRNAFALRQGIVWRDVIEWGARDPGVSTREAVTRLKLIKRCKTQYDSVGMGSSVKAEYNRLVDENKINAATHAFIPWNAGGAVQYPYNPVIADDAESIKNKDFFKNMKAQAWWSLRTRFYKTWNNLTNNIIYPIEELISLDSTMKLLPSLMKELAQPVRKDTSDLRMVVDKIGEGKSPNLADAGVMMYFPALENLAPIVGSYGN